MQTTLHFECDGAGDDLLLIHGFASSMQMWTPLVEALRSRYRCWRVDLTGFASTPLPDDDAVIDVRYHLDSLIAFCDAHAIRPRALIGHSMGGLLALWLARLRPDLAARLALMCPVVTGQNGLHFQLFQQLFTSPLKEVIVNRGEPLLRLTQAQVALRWFGSHPALTPVTIERVQRDWERTTWRAAAGALGSMGSMSAEPFLREIAQPALIIVGARDFTVPPQEGRLAAAKLPCAELVEYDGGFHQPLDEQPERTCALVERFLAAVAADLNCDRI